MTDQTTEIEPQGGAAAAIDAATKVSFAWVLPPGYVPSAAAQTAALADIARVVPTAVLDRWSSGQVARIQVDGHGHIDAARLKAYAAARLLELKALRPAGASPITVRSGVIVPASVVYVYTGGQLVSVNVLKLDEGNGPWSPPPQAGEPTTAIGMQISWVVPHD